MQLEEFEKMWPIRHELDEETLRRLENEAQTNPLCRDYVNFGQTTRQAVSLLGTDEAPANFAYKMRIYAENHPEEVAVKREKPFFRWASLGVGMATGAAAIMIAVTSMNPELGSPTNMTATIADETPNVEFLSTGAEAPEMDATDARSTLTDQEVALQEPDSTHDQNRDSEQPREHRQNPNWDMRSVSTQP